MLWWANGGGWEPLDTTDAPATQQATAQVPALGYVLVAGVPTPSPSAATPAADAGTPPLAVALLVAAGVVLLIGVGLLIRGRSR